VTWRLCLGSGSLGDASLPPTLHSVAYQGGDIPTIRAFLSVPLPDNCGPPWEHYCLLVTIYRTAGARSYCWSQSLVLCVCLGVCEVVRSAFGRYSQWRGQGVPTWGQLQEPKGTW
jgi:hypothetical protein